MKKTISKSQVINYIKNHGEKSSGGEWKTTINGVLVGNCRTTITLYDEHYKFPSFTSVTLDDYELVFEAKNSTVSYNNSARKDNIVDSYFRVIEGIMIGMGLLEEEVEELENNGLTVKTSKGYILYQVLDENVDCGKEWVQSGWFYDDLSFTNEKFYYFSNYYGSEGGFYNEEKNVIIPSLYVDEMDEEDFIEAYGITKEEAEELKFVEEPVIRELDGLHIENENGKYGPLVIKDEKGFSYKDGQGIYKFRNGLFYRVVLK